MLRSCEYGCNGCDECTDWDELHEPPEFGCCLPPGECCMPGLHFPSECHTAADYERAQFGGVWFDVWFDDEYNISNVAQAN